MQSQSISVKDIKNSMHQSQHARQIKKAAIQDDENDYQILPKLNSEINTEKKENSNKENIKTNQIEEKSNETLKYDIVLKGFNKSELTKYQNQVKERLGV